MADINPLDPNAAQLMDLSQQRKLADLLTQQGLQSPQGQMVSGQYVKSSPLQYLANMANLYAGQKTGEAATQKATDYANALRQQGGIEVQDILETYKTDPNAALRKASVAVSPEAKSLATQLSKVAITEKPTSVQEYQYAQQNPQFAQYQTGLKRAGAPSTVVSMGKSIAGEIGPMMKEAQGMATAAVKTEDSANRIIQSIDSNKLFTGTGANVRLGAAQIANTLGFGGDTLQAKIGNTRQAMQGLAELTLQGRQQMRGQGAITESESKLAERAISGDINFTPGEIKQLANAAKRSSEHTYGTYQSKLQSMAQNPDTAGLVPYYEVPRMTPQGAMPNQSAIDAEIARRQGKR